MMLHRLRPVAVRPAAAQTVAQAVARPQRHFSVGAALKSTWQGFSKSERTVVAASSVGAACGGLWLVQCGFGNAEHWFDQRFVTTKDPDALAEFYQAEDLLRIIAVIPPMFSFFMNKVVPDESTQTEETCLLNTEETKFNVRLLGMEVSFQILEEELELEDGETVLKSFCRYERFVDWVPLLADMGIKIKLWDQTWRYGFERLEDGTYEVYHKCEDFKGPFPIRWIVFLHQTYVTWGCEKVINGDAFGTEDLDALDEELACVPLSEIKKFLGLVKAAKEEEIEAMKSEEEPDEEAIAEATASIARIEKLAEREASSISVSKRAYPTTGTSGRTASRGKIVVGDTETAKVLGEVMKDAKVKRAASVAMQQLVVNAMQSPDTAWQQRAMSRRGSVARTLSRRASNVSQTPAPVACREAPPSADAASAAGSDTCPPKPEEAMAPGATAVVESPEPQVPEASAEMLSARLELVARRLE